MEQEKLEKLKGIIRDCWKDSRNLSKLLINRSDDFFIGYATGITVMNNLSMLIDAKEIATTIEQMLKDKEI